VSAFKVGTRNAVAIRYRLLLFEDRVEEVGETLLGLEIRRLFFDEVECATVHQASRLLGILAGGSATAVLLLGAVGAGFGQWFPGVYAFAVLTLVAACLTAYAVVRPPFRLVLRAPSHSLEALLSRDAAKREEAIRRLTRAIDRFQVRHATPSEAPPPELPGPEPRTGH